VLVSGGEWFGGCSSSIGQDVRLGRWSMGQTVYKMHHTKNQARTEPRKQQYGTNRPDQKVRGIKYEWKEG
jgi:hypothetical protein